MKQTGREFELVNPARAGMIRIRRRAPTTSVCKPRASGDDPAAKERWEKDHR